MDSRHRKTPSSDRYLGIFSNPPSQTTAGDELNEDDVFFSADFTNSNNNSNNHSVSVSVSPSSPANGNQFNHTIRSENFGILAALPEGDTRSVFNHKASVSPSSSTSSTTSFRTIPKRPPLDRQSSTRIQSAPVNVPMLSEAMRRSIAMREFENADVVLDSEEEGERLPPHEIVDAKQSLSPVLSSSVLEGVGRTLKGRDLRQVRNAVFRKTGFID